MPEIRNNTRPPRGGAGYWARHLRIYLPVVIVFVGFAIFEPAMFSVGNLRNISLQASYIAIFTIAQALVLLSRGFDLSIGAGVSLVSMAAALTMKNLGIESPFLAIGCGVCAGLLVGAIIGFFNGVLVAVTGINAFIATLGTANILFALSSTISGGFPVGGLPRGFTALLAEGTMLGVPLPMLLAVAVFIAVSIMLRCTVVGRSLYLIGSNPRAARAAGIPVRFHLLLVYVICALLAAIGSILMTARTGSGEPNLGGSLALQTIAAAVIGGVSLRGGEGGGALSALLGALLITVMSNGMDFLRIDGYLQEVFFGLIIIISLLFDRYSSWQTRS